jgi:ribosome-associated protein
MARDLMAIGEPLHVRTGLDIAASEIEESFGPSGGPGGQHANRAHTRVELRFDVTSSRSLTEHQRDRLIEGLGPDVRVTVDDERSQARNRAIARDRLAARLRHALEPRRKRTATRPTAGSRRRRLDSKRQRSDVKRMRRPPRRDD